MSLSDAGKRAIEESEKINNVQQRQRAQQRAQQEKEYNELIQQQQELEKQLAAEQHQQQNENAQISERDAIIERYRPQFEELQAAQNQIQIPLSEILYDQNTRSYVERPIDRSERERRYNVQAKKINVQIENLRASLATELNYYDYSKAYPNQPLQGSVRDIFNQSDPRKTSLVELQQKREQAFEEKRISQRQTDIQKSQSYAAAERARLNKIIAEFDQAKEENNKKQLAAATFSTPLTKAGDLLEKPTPPKRELIQPDLDPIEPNTKAIESFEKTQKAKSDLLEKTLQGRPKEETHNLSKGILEDSKAFLTKSPVTASNILGLTKQRSDKAVFTFEQTQQQQKELYKKLLTAKNSKEAIAIIEAAQALNPYVGTPQTANTKLGKAEQGVLIEKKIESTKQELDDYFSNASVVIPGSQTITTTKETKQESYWTIPDPQNPGKNLGVVLPEKGFVELKFKTEESANKYIKNQNIGLSKTQTQQETQTPVTFDFVNEKGEIIPPTNELLWRKMEENLTEVKPYSKVDIDFNQSLREYQEANPGKDIEIYKDVEGAKPFIQEPALVAAQEHAMVFTSLGEDVIQIINPNYEKKINLKNLPFETIATEEAIKTGSYLLGISEEKPKESNTLKYIKEKIQTPEGIETLGASIVGSAALIYATQGKSAFVNAAKPAAKEIKVLTKIAEDVFKPKIIDDFRTARIKELNPDIEDPKAIERLKEIMYPKQTPAEIQQSKQLKEIYPNLPQSKIDYMVEQTTKAQKIAEQEKRAKLEKLFKERFPDMPQEKISQKVATMTAKESSDIPYNIEKISSKSYLISSGREANPTDYPFIVVNFKRSRFGKEIGTYDVYQPITDKTIKPTDLLIQRAQSKGANQKALSEMERGRNISNTKTTTITRYPVTGKNILKATDENSNLALIGAIKTGKLSELKKYPKETIDSMIKDERQTAVLESKHELETLAKNELKAKQQYQKGLDELTKTKTNPKPVIPENKTIELPPTGKSRSIIETPKPDFNTSAEKINLSTNQKTLKEIAKNAAKERIDIKKTNSVFSATSAALVSTSYSMGQKADATIKQAQQTQQSTQQSIRQQQRQAQQSRQELNIDLETKSEIKNSISEKIILDLNRIQERRQILDPRFSLITSVDTSLDVTQDQGTRTKERYRLKEEFDQIYDRPTPRETKTTLKTPPLLPNLSLNLEEKKTLETKKPKGKLKIMFYRWNTNTEAVGQYLPTQDLSTGKTSKIIQKVDRLQKKVNKRGYAEKKQRQVNNFYETTIKENKGGRLVKKSNIVNISEPKGKEAKKFLKKFKVNFGF